LPISAIVKEKRKLEVSTMTWQEIDTMMRSCIGKKNRAVFVASAGLKGPRVTRAWEHRKRVHLHVFQMGLWKLREEDRISNGPFDLRTTWSPLGSTGSHEAHFNTLAV
jgi:hypothetical protein